MSFLPLFESDLDLNEYTESLMCESEITLDEMIDKCKENEDDTEEGKEQAQLREWLEDYKKLLGKKSEKSDDDSDDDDEKATKESVEYEKIQVLREAVEDKFIDGELDYEEYEALTNRLDEKEMYLEAKKHKTNELDEYLDRKAKEMHTKEYFDRKIKERDKEIMKNTPNIGGFYSKLDTFKNQRDEAQKKLMDAQEENKLLQSRLNVAIDHESKNIKEKEKLRNQRDNAAKAAKENAMRLKDKNIEINQLTTKLKKDHKLAMAGIAAATAVGAGAGALAVMVAKRNNDVKMCDDLDKIQAQLTDLGTQRTEVVERMVAVNRSLAKAKDDATVKVLTTEIKKGETLLKKIDYQIKGLKRKAEVIGKKLEKYKNKK